MPHAARKPGEGRTRRHGDHRDEDHLHAPGRGAGCATGRCCIAAAPWPSSRPASSTKPASAGACHRHLQVSVGAAQRRGPGRSSTTAPDKEGRMSMMNKQSTWCRAPPARPSPPISAGRSADTPDCGRPGAGAQPYLSLDPYMRGRMNDMKSYAAPQPLGEPMVGGTVGEVVESTPRWLQGGRQRRRHGRLAGVHRDRRPHAGMCAKWTRRTCRCRPTWARSACPASRPGSG